MGEMVMWLKLTSFDDTKLLINFDKIIGVCIMDDMTSVIDIERQTTNVKESLEEIELMLNGVKQQVDPRERNVIGNRYTVRDSQLSESDFNLRYNKP